MIGIKNRQEISYILFAVFAVILAVYVRIRLLNVPFERDEGEYAYAGWLMLQGVPPYLMAYSMKLPGIYAVYALIIAVTGGTVAGIHFFLMCVNMLSVFFVYLLGKRFYDKKAGLAAAAIFALLTISKPFQGIFANAEHFVLVFALPGILLLTGENTGQKARYILLSGLLLGVSFVIKQHGIFFAAFGFFCLLYYNRKNGVKNIMRSSLVFLSGAALLLLITIILFAVAGALDDLYFWTVIYAMKYGTAAKLNTVIVSLTERFKSMFPFVWQFIVLAFGGAAASLLSGKARKNSMVLFGFAFFSAAALSVGLYFRWHYFIYILPAASVFGGIGISMLDKYFAGKKRFWCAAVPLLLFVVFLSFVVTGFSYFFKYSPDRVSSYVYPGNAFAATKKIAGYIQRHSEKTDKVAVFGSEPQIYFYSKRESATGFIYMYPLMETHRYASKFQDLMIYEVIGNRPEYIVYVKNRSSWLKTKDSEDKIFIWLEEYLKDYKKQGVIDVLGPAMCRCVWAEEAAGYKHRGGAYIDIYVEKEERKN